jgi:hypothetical protein
MSGWSKRRSRRLDGHAGELVRVQSPSRRLRGRDGGSYKRALNELSTALSFIAEQFAVLFI